MSELYSEMSALLEALDDHIRALHAISGLCTGCKENEAANIDELPYLLDPIIEGERAIAEDLHARLLKVFRRR